jgi:3-oxoacyl-[acyl-carrier protein] reductase
MRVAVVTGASRGLGRHTAVALAKAGYNVGVNYFHSMEEAGEVMLGTGIPSIALKADVGNSHEVEKMAETVRQQWGRIDVLVNNAGIARDGLLIRYREDEWDEVMRVNLKGCFNMVKYFAPLMIKSGGGHIINISSYSGFRGKAGQAAYSASKASVAGFSCSLARELGGYNIKVNCVLPGYMPTEMGMGAEQAMKTAEEESVLRRLSDPAEVAEFITYLVTTETITGQVFCLDSRI